MTYEQIVPLILPLVALLITALLTIALTRFRGGPISSAILAGGVSSLLVLIGLLYTHPHVFTLSFVAYYWISFVGYLYCFLHYINLGQTSLRLKIISEIVNSPSGQLARDTLFKNYNQEKIFKVRMERLIENKNIVLKEQRYVLNNRILWLCSNLVFLFRKIVLNKSHQDS